MLLWLLALTSVSIGQTLPAQVRDSPPIVPEELLQTGEQASVLLELDIDATGRVTEARVVESASEAVDLAAVQAALGLGFTTATDAQGRAVPVTIQYRTVFDPQSAPVVSLEGRVQQAGTRQPLADVTVTLTFDGTTRQAITDSDGRFQVADLAPGTWTVAAQREGFTDETASASVRAGSVAQVTLYPTASRPWEIDDADTEIEVLGRRVAPEVTERVLSTEEIRYLPGTGGDIVRVVQNLPGVARPPLGIGQLIIRGTAPEQSAYYLDGSSIPNVFHFAGLSTVLNGDAIAEVAFLPGNYGVRYGRTLGGVVDLRVDTELPERSRGYVSVDLFQSTIFVDQKTGANSALTVSGRRSYIDAVLTPVLSGLGSASVQAPRYYDLQARWRTKLPTGGDFDVLALWSDDQFRVVGENADGEEQVQIGLSNSFGKLRLRWTEEVGGGWRHELSAIGGPENQSFDFAGGEAYERPLTFAFREEWYRDPRPGLGLRAGLDVQVGSYAYVYDVPGFPTAERGDTSRFAPGAYIESTGQVGVWSLTPGVRVDGIALGDYRTAALDPRLSSRVDLGTTRFKAAAGGYSQFPNVREAIAQPELGPQRSWQTSAGIEQDLTPSLSVEATGFYNLLDQLVVGREDAFRFFSGPPPVGPADVDPYANEGVGSVVGVESIVQLRADRTTAWLSATVSRSVRTAREGDDRALFEYDQPVVLTALASHQLPKRWRLGGRARFGSGNPFTPVVNRFYSLDSRTFLPVYGDLDSERLPAFWAVDVRIDKDWVMRNWTLTAYLDVQNTTNNQNAEVMAWTYDYAEEDPITSLPLVPAFGLRGEW